MFTIDTNKIVITIYKSSKNYLCWWKI